MVEATAGSAGANDTTPAAKARFPYDAWMESLGLPIHRGYFIPDLRTAEVAWWPERECGTAFIQLLGQEGITEARITEIPPGKTLPPLRFALDEAVYVADGRGLTTVWAGDGKPKKTFEWQKHSLFMLPHNHTHQLSNMQGDKTVRLLHYNYLPLAMTAIQDAHFFFNNPYESSDVLNATGDDFYSEAKITTADERAGRLGLQRSYWLGNFFPDLRAWDKIVPLKGRGAGGRSVVMRFPNAQLWMHMSVFPARTYKKAHRHGPGRTIVIPAGEGYSIMWEEGQEKVIVPWHEASAFTPPARWFHQHFNVGGTPARYLALHPPDQFHGHAERVEDRARDQIEYPDEEPWIRERFEAELAARGLASRMPEEAYRERDFEWAYEEGD